MIQKPEPLTVRVKEHSSVPKYIQVADNITASIKSGKIKEGQRIPSINDLSEKNKMSRDTIEKAYKVLRDRNVIFSVKGLGNFVADPDPASKIDVFFLINKPSSYKMEIYNSFVSTIGVRGHVSMYLYYCDEMLFINALKKNLNNHDYFVILPHFKNKAQNHVNYTTKTLKAIETVPKDKLIILDNSCSEISGNFTAIYQDYKGDIIEALEKALQKLKKYKKIILVHPTKSIFPYPARVVDGFIQFCELHQFSYEILDKVYPDLEFECNEAYITVEDGDLVHLIQQIREKNLLMGKDIGVISYNETPLKALLGITVFSTDFTAMGESAAQLAVTGNKEIFKNPFKYIERNSL